MPDKHLSSRQTACIVYAFITTILLAACIYALNFMSLKLGGQNYYCLQDDSMISMRYAANLAGGLGLVWNRGEPIQGFTNLGWTLLMSLIHLARFQLPFNSLLMQLINCALLVSMVSIIYWSLLKRAGLFAASLAALITAFNSSIFIYTINGFETTLQTLLLVPVYLPLVPADRKAGELAAAAPQSMLFSALSALVRPDSILFWVWSVLLNQTNFMQNKDSSARLKTIAAALLSAAMLAGMFSFQRIYYGSILPNTFYLKAAGGGDSSWWSAWYFLENFVITPQGVLLLSAFCYLGLCAGNKVLRLRSLALLSLIFVWIVYVFSVGGDTFLYGRFYIAIIPLLSVCTGLLAAALFESRKREAGAPPAQKGFRQRKIAGWTIMLLIAWQLSNFPCEVLKALSHEKWKNESSIAAALTVREHHLPHSYRIALFRAGATPYFLPDYRFHDMLGKSDGFIARTPVKWGPPGHNKWDIDYSLNKIRPEILIVAFEGLSDTKAKQELEAKEPFGFTPELWLNSAFVRCYKNNVLQAPQSVEKQLRVNRNPYEETIMFRAGPSCAAAGQ